MFGRSKTASAADPPDLHGHRREPLSDRLRMPRSRGGMSGALLVLAGLWGGLIPFVGPWFDWVVGPDDAWDMTAGRFWISILAAIATIAGGLIVLRAANRATGSLGAWLALAGGAWFAVGPTVSRLWNDGQSLAGEPLGGPTQQALETLTYFEGLGALIVALAAFALGRMTLRALSDVDTTAPTAGEETEVRPRTGRFDRRPATESETDDRTETKTADEPHPVAGGGTPGVPPHEGERPTGRF